MSLIHFQPSHSVSFLVSPFISSAWPFCKQEQQQPQKNRNIYCNVPHLILLIFFFTLIRLTLPLKRLTITTTAAPNDDHKNRKQYNTQRKQSKKKRKKMIVKCRDSFLSVNEWAGAHAHGLFVYARLVNRSKSNEKCFFVLIFFYFLLKAHDIDIGPTATNAKKKKRKKIHRDEIQKQHKKNIFNPTETNIRVADYQFKPFCE